MNAVGIPTTGQVQNELAPPSTLSFSNLGSWVYYQATRLATTFVTHAPLLLMGIALYYLLTQVLFKQQWDAIWPTVFWRHLGRGTTEVILAGAGAQAVTFDSFAFERRVNKAIAKREAKGKNRYTWFDRLEIWTQIVPNRKQALETPLTKWQRRLFPVVGLAYMAPGFILAGFAILLGQDLFSHVHHGALVIGQHSYHVHLKGHTLSVWQKLVTIYTKEGGPKIAGLVSSVIMLRRPMTAVFYDNHRLYAQRRCTFHKARLHLYHKLVPAYSQRVKATKALGAYPPPPPKRHRFRHACKVAAVVLGVAGVLAFGYHVQVDIIPSASSPAHSQQK